MVTPGVVTARALACPSCGASITLHAEGWAVTVVCATCGAVLDALDPNLQILQRHEQRLTVTPKIPLGTRGTIDGAEREVIGCQRVTITVEGTDYSWMEYVCFNPYHGFLYLSEYEGHWNVIEKLRVRPEEQPGSGRPVALLNGRRFAHFQSADARTTFALGEFPWELRVGDAVRARDFVSPPLLLSAEGTAYETTWSLGRYTTPKAMAKMFGLPALDRRPEGVFANQPNPHVRSARRVRRVALPLLAVWAALLVVVMLFSGRDEVLSQQYTYDRTLGEANAVVTEPFELAGRASNVRLAVRTSLDNDWAWFAMALIDDRSGQSREVGKQVSYYYGQDSDGSWTEGSRSGAVTVSEVPAGRYVLRIGPEGGEAVGPPVTYTVTVTRDVPNYLFFGLALAALLVPAALAWFPAFGFESRRWMESDHESPTISFPPEEKTA